MELETEHISMTFICLVGAIGPLFLYFLFSSAGRIEGEWEVMIWASAPSNFKLSSVDLFLGLINT